MNRIATVPLTADGVVQLLLATLSVAGITI
jgi:hypothetical protein